MGWDPVRKGYKVGLLDRHQVPNQAYGFVQVILGRLGIDQR